MASTTRARAPVLPRGALLLGGRSTPMGRPKALLELDGIALGLRVAAALLPWVSSIAAVGSTADVDPEPWAARLGTTFELLPDRQGVEGPLAGLLALFDLAPDSWWVVAACDLPCIETEAVEWLLDQRTPTAAAVLPEALGRVQPLLALYGPRSRALLETRAASGSPSPRLLVGQEGVLCPRVPHALEPSWTNVNTVQEWRRFTR